MSNSLRTSEDYELFLYTITDQFPSVRRSTVESVKGELLTVQKIHTSKHLVVVYREIENDGFIITAFITSKRKSPNRRNQLWPK